MSWFTNDNPVGDDPGNARIYRLGVHEGQPMNTALSLLAEDHPGEMIRAQIDPHPDANGEIVFFVGDGPLPGWAREAVIWANGPWPK